MSYWLLKTEPVEYCWDDLIKEKEGIWDGVKAPAAVANIKKMKPGDLAFIYHTGKEKAIIGIAEITSPPYSDSNDELVFKLRPIQPLPTPITLKEIKFSGKFLDWDLVRLPRLSVLPVSQFQWDNINNWPLSNPI